MNAKGQGSYGEYRVLTASPVASIRMLYDKMISSVEAARECVRQKDPEGRARNVSAAFSILTELTASLNHEVAPGLSARLKALYEYLQWRLVTGHAERNDGAFQDVERILRSMREAWVVQAQPAGEDAAPGREAVRPQPRINPYERQRANQAADRSMYL
jgi:flagellar protein FliS